MPQTNRYGSIFLLPTSYNGGSVYGYLNDWVVTESTTTNSKNQTTTVHKPTNVTDSDENTIIDFGTGWSGNLQTLASGSEISGTDIDGNTISYTKGFSIGGGSSGTRYIKVTVPTGKTADVYVAFVTGSNGNERGCGIGTAASTTDFAKVSKVSSSSTSTMSYLKTEESLAAGTYYINADNNIRFYAIQVRLN